MNRQVITYSLLLIALAAVILLLFSSRIPFGKRNSSFAVNEDANISRIELIRGSQKISIKETGGKWFINDNVEARKSAVVAMLRIIREMKIKSPVSSEVFNNEIVKNHIEPVRVNVFSKRRLIRSFFVYKTGSNIYGNVMKMKASSKPFIVFLPGYEDNIGIHFITDELFWKPFFVFHLLPSEIGSVKSETVSDSASSFMISCKNRSFVLSDLRKDLKGWDTSKVKRYLSYFTSVSFENWAFELSDADRESIEGGKPLYRITVNPTAGKEIVLTVWERSAPGKTSGKPDTDRVWAKTNLNDAIFIMKYLDLDPVLKRRSYFFN